MVRLFFWLLIIFSVCSYSAYLWVDTKVLELVNRSFQTEPSAIYSDSAEMRQIELTSVETIKRRLLSRNYVPVKITPISPGEFLVENKKIEVITREFKDPVGANNPSLHLIIDTSTGLIKKITGDAVNSLKLEPMPLSTLGGTSVRASRYVPLKDIPQGIRDAVLAIEDRRFYQHFGVDPIGIARAAFINLTHLRWVQGGSTITQQLAKNSLLTSKKNIGRKFLEVLAAISIEKQLSKNQILERYLNEVYLGQEGSVAIHGMEEASRTFFAKSISELNLSETALLAGIIQAPSAYSPRRAIERALARREVVLAAMAEAKFISEQERQKALKYIPTIIDDALHERKAPFFVEALEKRLTNEHGLDLTEPRSLRVYTGLDLDYQSCAEDAVRWGLQKLDAGPSGANRSKREPLQAALVSIQPFSGLIRSWVGGRDFRKSQFDRVSQASRQVGSTIKPFVYLTAIDPSLNSYRPATTISVLADEPTAVDGEDSRTWTPENYDHDYRGDVTLRQALENSLNLPAVYLSQKVGIQAVARTVRNFRLSPNVPEVPALALGALDTNLLSMVSAYSALANGGNFAKPRFFKTAIDQEAHPILATELEEFSAADEGAVFIVTDIMRGVVDRGTGAVIRRLEFERPAAGKTGTSNDTRDAWFIGFTPNLATGVWVGYDDNSKTGLTGARAAAPIWARYMNCIKPFLPADDFVRPASVSEVAIDRITLQVATPACPGDYVANDLFLAGTEPSEPCTRHGKIDRPRSQPDPQITPQNRGKGWWEHLFFQ